MTDIALPIPDAYWVESGRFLAGEYPGTLDPESTRRRMDAFLEAGIDTFFDLTHDHELPAYLPILADQARHYEREIAYHRFAIRDRGLPEPGQMTALLNAIDASLAAGRKVYVHCWGGVGRTGMTVGCYLVRRGRTGRQALDQLAAWWQDVPKRVHFPRSPETDEQVEFILNWHDPHPKSK
ncbi:MAG: protein-tyrosine phosphatase family protein [Chloroflexota bacterium]